MPTSHHMRRREGGSVSCPGGEVATSAMLADVDEFHAVLVAVNGDVDGLVGDGLRGDAVVRCAGADLGD